MTVQILPSPKPLRVQNFFVENPSVANGLRVAKSVGTGLKYEKGPSLHFEDDNGGVRRESSISVREVIVYINNVSSSISHKKNFLIPRQYDSKILAFFEHIHL